MVLRKGKEPASAPDDLEAPETVQDTRWLNGVNRQLRPDAPSQRQGASAAAAIKRKAGAMSEEERKAKRDGLPMRCNSAWFRSARTFPWKTSIHAKRTWPQWPVKTNNGILKRGFIWTKLCRPTRRCLE